MNGLLAKELEPGKAPSPTPLGSDSCFSWNVRVKYQSKGPGVVLSYVTGGSQRKLHSQSREEKRVGGRFAWLTCLCRLSSAPSLAPHSPPGSANTVTPSWVLCDTLLWGSICQMIQLIPTPWPLHSPTPILPRCSPSLQLTL